MLRFVNRSPRSWGSLAAVAACVVLGASSAPAGAVVLRASSASTYPVPDGTTWSRAYKTVQQALDAANPGDEVWVAKGTYKERIFLRPGVALYGGFAGTEGQLSDRNWRVNPTVVDGQGTTSVVLAGQGVTGARIDGFTLQNGIGIYRNGAPASAIHCDGATLTIANNRIQRNLSKPGGTIICKGGTVTITGNTIIDNNNGITGAAVYCDNADVTLAGNVVASNRGRGVFCHRGTVRLYNNTISANSALDGGLLFDGGTIYAANNIVAYNAVGVAKTADSAAIDFHRNCVAGNTQSDFSGFTAGADNLLQDPKIANPYDDPHLLAGSPCINAGDTASIGGLTTDIDGEARTASGTVDIGADEYNAAYTPAPVTVFRAAADGQDGNSGQSWSAPKTLSGAIAAARPGDEIWVKAGTYPGQFVLKAGLHLYGGFAGSETQRDQRDWAHNATVLGGSTTGAVVLSDYHGGRLDGFTVQNGTDGGVVCSGVFDLANSTVRDSTSMDHGGGMAANAAVLTMTNTTVSGNHTLSFGAGLAATDSFITVSRSSFLSNDTLSMGGGIYWLRSSGTMDNSVLAQNSAGYGGGLYISAGTLNAINLTIADNQAGLGGSGVAAGGGGVFSQQSTVTMTNSIVSGNSSGIADLQGSTWILRRNAVSNNTAYAFSGVPDPTGTNGNLGVDPLFQNAPSGDYHLSSSSPCIDKGDDSVITPGMTDRDGQERIKGAHVDMGAYEIASGGTALTMQDSVNALLIASGLMLGTPTDLARLDVAKTGASLDRVDVVDALLIARLVRFGGS